MPINKFLRRLFGFNRRGSNHNTSEFTKIWNHHKKLIGNSDTLVKAVATDVSIKINSGQLDSEQIIKDGLKFTGETTNPDR